MKRVSSVIALAHQPQVVWVTGLSGAGKSTIARRVVDCLRRRGLPTLLLDGDDVRLAVSDPHIGHDRVSRLTNAMRIARLAKLLSEQGFIVVVPTMSLFREVHLWNREQLPNYLEVWVQVSLEVLRQRDARGLYSRAARGEASDVVGVHVEYDEPKQAHLVLRNDQGEAGLEDLVRQVVARIGAECHPL